MDLPALCVGSHTSYTSAKVSGQTITLPSQIFTNTSDIQDIAISPVDSSKSVIFNAVSSYGESDILGGCLAYFIDDSTVRLERGRTGGVYRGYGYITVLEFTSGAIVQQGVGNSYATISAVDWSKSFAICQTCIKSSSVSSLINYENFWFPYSSTSLRFSRMPAGVKRSWFVISFE